MERWCALQAGRQVDCAAPAESTLALTRAPVCSLSAPCSLPCSLPRRASTLRSGENVRPARADGLEAQGPPNEVARVARRDDHHDRWQTALPPRCPSPASGLPAPLSPCTAAFGALSACQPLQPWTTAAASCMPSAFGPHLPHHCILPPLALPSHASGCSSPSLIPCAAHLPPAAWAPFHLL